MEEAGKRMYHRSKWFGGTNQYYSYAPLADWLLVTDGIKETCDELGCWWVIDIIASLGNMITGCEDSFRAVKVHLEPDSKAVFLLEDGNNNKYYMQSIIWTDLKEDLMIFLEYTGEHWLALMPEEH